MRRNVDTVEGDLRCWRSPKCRVGGTRILPSATWAALVLLAGTMSACHEREPQEFTVGVLSSDPCLGPAFNGFRQALTQEDYSNQITYLFNETSPTAPEPLDVAARQLVADHVDLILSLGTTATTCAQNATVSTEIPVVFAVIDDPVGSGFVKSIADPAGNITGVSYLGLQEPPRMQWLKRIVPGTRRVYMPSQPASSGTALSLPLARQAAAELGIELVEREVADNDALDDAIQSIPEEVDAIFLPPDSLLCSAMDRWVAAADARQLPLCVPNNVHVRRGALLSYGFTFFDAGRQAARLADQILRGARPGTLPVEIPEFFLSINLKTARALGIDIPNGILCQAADIVR
ncbi:MAG TPA: ABC transporter substrate-binding protein [Candidatus Hydrogenedentes bacterium]|nr:ABC transporter substrate-binding protein [Candidatus Hydrogenedentota bacterium]HPG67503.1 ABC transporter substrate-binding protein [Candidatus Hydrogenedentota bacterium]